MVVRALSGMPQSIDLCRDVVIDEERATVPRRLARIIVYQRRQFQNLSNNRTYLLL